MSDYRRWTSEEEQCIRDHWKTQSDAEMAIKIYGIASKPPRKKIIIYEFFV